MSCRRLQRVFNVSIFRLPRRLEDISQDALEDEKLLRWRRLEYILKTSWRQAKFLLWISVSNKSLSQNFISVKFKASPENINYGPLISKIVLFWNSISISILKIETSDNCWCFEISWIYSYSTLQNRWRNKSEVLSNIPAQMYLNE